MDRLEPFSRHFWVHGNPKPQARPRAVRRGRFVTIYSPKSDWYKQVVKETSLNRPEMPLSAALRVEMEFRMPRPKSARKTQFWAIKRPDLDNLAKAVMDAMTEAGWWKDDSLIVVLNTKKYLAHSEEKPGVYVSVMEWGG